MKQPLLPSSPSFASPGLQLWLTCGLVYLQCKASEAGSEFHQQPSDQGFREPPREVNSQMRTNITPILLPDVPPPLQDTWHSLLLSCMALKLYKWILAQSHKIILHKNSHGAVHSCPSSSDWLLPRFLCCSQWKASREALDDNQKTERLQLALQVYKGRSNFFWTNAQNILMKSSCFDTVLWNFWSLITEESKDTGHQCSTMSNPKEMCVKRWSFNSATEI